MAAQDELTDLYSDLLADAYELVTDSVVGLETAAFEQRTRTAAWTVAELLFHQLQDAERALVAFASTTDAPADVEQVSYWRPFRPSEGDGGAAHAEWVQQSAAAYADPAALVSRWQTTSEAAVRAAREADPAGRVQTQGHVIAVPDFLSTLVVEATVHLLDLTVELTGSPPTAQALTLTRSVLEGLFGAPLPTRWDDTEAVLKGTGRVPLDDDDLIELGSRAGELPLLG
jgi:hypothetical protein